MTEEQTSKLFYLGYIPKCPFYKPINLLIYIVLIAFGTWGTYYLNVWAAVAYPIYVLLFIFVLMPFTMCRFCYFRVKETATDEEKGKTMEKLLTVEGWSTSHLPKHVGQKHWVWPMLLIWVVPIVLTIISFFKNFHYLTIIALVGFIAVLAGYFLYVIKIKCQSCPIREECHSSF